MTLAFLGHVPGHFKGYYLNSSLSVLLSYVGHLHSESLFVVLRQSWHLVVYLHLSAEVTLQAVLLDKIQDDSTFVLSHTGPSGDLNEKLGVPLSLQMLRLEVTKESNLAFLVSSISLHITAKTLLKFSPWLFLNDPQKAWGLKDNIICLNTLVFEPITNRWNCWVLGCVHFKF